MLETQTKPQVFEDTKNKKISKILVVLQPETYDKAIDEVIEFAKSGIKELKAYLLYVVDLEPLPALDYRKEKQMFDEMEKGGVEVIEKARKKLQESGIPVEILPMHFGIAHEEVLRTEEYVRPDLVVTQKRAFSRFERLLNGSITDKLAKNSKVPVVIVN